MKKFLLLLLICLQILVGCMNQEPEQSRSTTSPVVTLPPAYYEENSEIEIASGGAVRQYALPDCGYSGIYRVGNGLLLTTDEEMSRLRMLTGETCIPSATIQLEQSYLHQCAAFSNGFAYYDEQQNSIYYLDSNLSQRHSVVMPDEMSSFVISPDGSLIYYTLGQEIRVLDVEKNISRLLKTQSVSAQMLLGTCFKGSILVCQVEDESGEKNTIYISAADGQTVREENGISQLYTSQDAYIALWADGVVERWVCGSTEGTAKRFAADNENFFDAMELGGIVGYTADEMGLNLSFYTIPEASKTAAITLKGLSKPDILFADKWTNCIWLIVDDHDGRGKMLLKWDVQKSLSADTVVYTDTLYTATNPDAAALNELQKRVEALNTKHGVKIRIWQDAVSAPATHTLAPEYHPQAISDMLDQLENVLNEFPKKFVYNSISSRVRICLIRSFDGKAEGQQYWDGRYAFVTLCSGSDVREDFLKGFGIVIDSHVLGNSPVYDYWDTLNPQGFRYGKPDETFVTGDIRYFVDSESMSSSMVDRSRIFWQAMQPDNAEIFKGEAMQKKLTMLCKAIRDAWNLEKKTDVYPWEQYLQQPIAKKK